MCHPFRHEPDCHPCKSGWGSLRYLLTRDGHEFMLAKIWERPSVARLTMRIYMTHCMEQGSLRWRRKRPFHLGYLLMAFELIEPPDMQRLIDAGVFDVMGFTVVPRPRPALLQDNGNVVDVGGGIAVGALLDGQAGNAGPVGALLDGQAGDAEPAAAAAEPAEAAAEMGPAAAASEPAAAGAGAWMAAAGLAAPAGVENSAAGTAAEAAAAAVAAAAQGPMHEVREAIEAMRYKINGLEQQAGLQQVCLNDMTETMTAMKSQLAAMLEMSGIQMSYMRDVAERSTRQQEHIEIKGDQHEKALAETIEKVDEVRADILSGVDGVSRQVIAQQLNVQALAEAVELQRSSLQRILGFISPPRPPTRKMNFIFAPCAKRRRSEF